MFKSGKLKIERRRIAESSDDEEGERSIGDFDQVRDLDKQLDN